MKKILMLKYGFVRWPEEDFSDDGNRFYCFRAGKCVRVSKLVSDGQVYISARIDGIKLPYKIYSNLPHYRALDALNGVSMDSLTDTDLEKLYADCLAYEQEYLEAERTIKYPTIEEITEQCKKINEHAEFELTNAMNIFNAHATNAAIVLNNYEWQQIKDCLAKLVDQSRELDSETKIERRAYSLYGTSSSFTFCSTTYSGLKESYYYKSFIKLINKVM
jgi:hypothetical protein